MQLLAPVGLNLPVGQRVQVLELDLPVEAEYLPEAQLVQLEDPVFA